MHRIFVVLVPNFDLPSPGFMHSLRSLWITWKFYSLFLQLLNVFFLTAFQSVCSVNGTDCPERQKRLVAFRLLASDCPSFPLLTSCFWAILTPPLQILAEPSQQVSPPSPPMYVNFFFLHFYKGLRRARRASSIVQNTLLQITRYSLQQNL